VRRLWNGLAVLRGRGHQLQKTVHAVEQAWPNAGRLEGQATLARSGEAVFINKTGSSTNMREPVGERKARAPGRRPRSQGH